MNIPKIGITTARNLALAAGLASIMSCKTPCNCKNIEGFDNFTKETTELAMRTKPNSLVKISQNIFRTIFK